MHLKMNQAAAIREKLLNDRTSSDAQLIDHFVNTIGIPEKMAKEYIASRMVYQTHPAFTKESKTDK